MIYFIRYNCLRLNATVLRKPRFSFLLHLPMWNSTTTVFTADRFMNIYKSSISEITNSYFSFPYCCCYFFLFIALHNFTSIYSSYILLAYIHLKQWVAEYFHSSRSCTMIIFTHFELIPLFPYADLFSFLIFIFCFFLNFVCDGRGCIHINAVTHRSKLRTLYLLELELQTVGSCTECVLELFLCNNSICS